ncbi:MAG: adenylosuccinate lyase [Candidatus Hodarchaeales archaeon]|jgi:adenylosuccinate lyase
MINPMENRYRTEIADFFEEQARIDKMVKVELALAKAHMKVGHISKDEFNLLNSAKNKVTVNLVKEIEKETRHDTMALVEALTRVSGCDKVHIGATSSDIIDTTLALQMRDANKILVSELIKLKDLLLNMAEEKIDLICIGRTHGQHALPTTYGMKFGLWAYEISECITDLSKTKFYGKMSGAIGTFASFGDAGKEIQKLVMDELKLSTPLITSQVVSRIFIAKYISTLVIVTCIIEKIAKEIRNLQRSEIREVAEAFGKKQTGSSTMPHKRNPVLSESLSSLAKRLRTNVLPALENISLEHERDLTNSANERIIIPETIILTHFLIQRMNQILQGLEFFEDNIERNITLNPEVLKEKKMIDLILKEGKGRQEAYNLAKQSPVEEDIKSYIGLSKEIVKETIKTLRNE